MEMLMERLATVVLAHRRAVLAGWLALCVVGGVFAAGLPSRIVPGGEAPSSSQSEAVSRALAGSPLPSLFLVVRVPETASAEMLAQAVAATAAAAQGADGVTAVTPFPAPPGARAGGGRIAVLTVSTSGGTDGAIQAAHALEERADAIASSGADVYVGGFGAYRDQLTELSRKDLERAERVGLPIVFIVLLLTFGTLWAAGLPMVIALSALLIGLGSVGFAGYFLPMSEFVTNASSMIGIALGVDYAMFLVQRVREAAGRDGVTDDAIRTAMRGTGTAVLWSGLTVLVAEATLLLVDSRSIRSAAFGMVMVTFFAMLTALVVAPVLISLLGNRLLRTPRGKRRVRGPGWWERWAGRVTGRPALWLAACSVVMIALALPTAGLRDSVNISAATTLPAEASVRQAYELTAEAYGPAALSPITVLIPPTEAAEVLRAVGTISRDPAVAAVQPLPLPDGSAVLAVTSRTGPYDAASRSLVTRLRSGDLRRQLTGVDYLVGGETATGVDATRAMFDSLPRVGVVLLVVVAVLLLFALRSVFLPLKAVLLVVLSLGTSLGGLLLLTGTKVGAWLIGADGPGDIHPIVPVTIVAIVVALSTDYEVMLISRIAEHYEDTGDNRGSVVAGVGSTGGVITSAAVIMIAVFLGFALADLAPLKQLGVGLGLAVLLDATLVRGVLVPASMAVMGRGNWWWPGRSRLGEMSPSELETMQAGGSAAAERLGQLS